MYKLHRKESYEYGHSKLPQAQVTRVTNQVSLTFCLTGQQ